MDSPIWDVRDCAPVYTPEQIGLLEATGKVDAIAEGLWSRLDRFEQTADVLDAICDGWLFAFPFEEMVRAVAEEEK